MVQEGIIMVNLRHHPGTFWVVCEQYYGGIRGGTMGGIRDGTMGGIRGGTLGGIRGGTMGGI